MHYRLYIDECGTDDVVNCHIIKHRYLALTGVIIDVALVRDRATPWMDLLKRKHFPDHDPDGPPLVLHRGDYLKGGGPFQPLQAPEKLEAFSTDLEKYLRAIQHTVITVVIDKHAMLRQAHWANKEPYHYCAEVMAEKFVQFLERKEARGDVFAESRKTRKNAALQKSFTEACESGTRYVPDPARFSQRLTTCQIKFREKPDNTTGLQIADTYAKPSFDRIMFQRDKDHPRTPFSERMGTLLFNSKYDRSAGGVRWGYGMKYII